MVYHALTFARSRESFSTHSKGPGEREFIENDVCSLLLHKLNETIVKIKEILGHFFFFFTKPDLE